MAPIARTTTRGRERFRQAAPFLAFAERVAQRVLSERSATWVLRATSRRRSAASRALRYVLLRTAAKRCGDLVDIREDVILLGLHRLELGSRISLHPFCYVDATGGLIIGDDVSIAHGVTILSTSHEYSEQGVPIRDQPVSLQPTRIGNDVWIGAGAKVVGGITVGNRVVIGTGAVVTCDVVDNVVVAGVPARVIRRLEP